MSKPTTSILILSKNRASLLQKNLGSLTKQTHKPNDIIVIDNQSTDNTQEVIKSYQNKLLLRSYITDLTGYASRYNFGAKKCTKELLCFLDDDCIAEPQWLQKLVEAHLKHPQDVIQGNTFALPKGNIYAEIMGDHYQNWIKSNIIGDNEMRTLDNKNIAILKTVFDQYHGFSEKQNLGSEDIEFGIRIRQNGTRIFFEPKAITWHHERNNFKAFIKQHQRIVKGESIVDLNVDKKNRIGILAGNKGYHNVISGVKREVVYLKNRDTKHAFQLPFLYLLLCYIRITGYCLTRIQNFTAQIK